MHKNLVVGAGISGAVIANLLAQIKKEKVLVIDKRQHIAGNIFDYKDDKTDITIQKYGPHFFHTNKDKIWKFLSNYTNWHYYKHKVLANTGKELINLPFNLAGIEQIFPNEAQDIKNELITEYGYNSKISILDLKQTKNKKIQILAEYIYENIYKNYTTKQWGKQIEELDNGIISRIPVYINYQSGYFDDKYQAIPSKGYTNLVKNLLNHKNITIKLNTDFKNIEEKFERIFYSGSIDEFFGYKFGILPYRSLKFVNKLLNKEYYQPSCVINYPNNHKFTRITEHKYILDEKSDKTIITLEFPKQFEVNQNIRYYPILNQENNLLYEKYYKEANKIKNLYFIGRLGKYKYYNIDSAIENVIELFFKL